MKASSPSLSDIEFTILLPWMQRNPASMTSHLEESIMTGTRDISGSAAIRLRKRFITATESSIPSSMLMSIIWAPSSTCCCATLSASSYSSSLINRLNFAEPVTLVRSPTFTNNESSPILQGSRPDSLHSTGSCGILRGCLCLTASANARIWSGVVPQQPPTIFRKPLSAHSAIAVAMSSAPRS